MFGMFHRKPHFIIETPAFTLTYTLEHHIMAQLTAETVAAITAQLNAAAQNIANIPVVSSIDDAELIAAANAVTDAVVAKTNG